MMKPERDKKTIEMILFQFKIVQFGYRQWAYSQAGRSVRAIIVFILGGGLNDKLGFSEVFAEFFGRTFFPLFKNSVEVRQIVKATLKTNFDD